MDPQRAYWRTASRGDVPRGCAEEYQVEYLLRFEHLDARREVGIKYQVVFNDCARVYSPVIQQTPPRRQMR